MEDLNSQPVVQVVNTPKKNNLLKFFLGLILIIFVLGLITGAYLLGKSNLRIVSDNQANPTPTVNVEITTAPTQSAKQSPTSTPAKSKIVEGGINFGVFMSYKITVPSDWDVNRETTKDVMDVVTISKDGYKIDIRQAGGEGSACVYGNEPDAMFTQKYATYVEFKSLDENFRRSGETGAKGWTMCHQIKTGWGFPVLYGYISYTNPANADENILKEMDSIVATIVKQ